MPAYYNIDRLYLHVYGNVTYCLQTLKYSQNNYALLNIICGKVLQSTLRRGVNKN